MLHAQVKSGSIFDNIMVSDDFAAAEAFATETWAKNKDGEKKMHDEIKEKEKAEAEAKAKESGPADAEDDAEDEDDDYDEPKEESGNKEEL